MNSIKTKEKKWIVESSFENNAKIIAKISEELKIHPIIAKLLFKRGYTDVKSAKRFIGMESEMLENPFDMKDISKGIERINQAILRKEKITVYGDYDVDGVTSVCTLYLYLKSKGADVDYYIPNRSGEGYGVSTQAIDIIKSEGTTLIITVDTGTTANDEVLYAKTLGVDFVITDHHECRADIPEACAVINPHRPDCKYPFKELAGVGVVFKLITAFEEKICKKSRKEAALFVFSKYADLVAIGTIADVMPIKEENRIIVSYGLNMIQNTERHGVLALMDASASRENQRADTHRKRSKITSGYVGYTLAPRINAAGRIRSAKIAVELFLADNMLDARAIAEELCLANKERQSEENKIMKEAYEKIESMNLDEKSVIVLDADTWHHGVIGIVASRITEKYSRPSILVSFEGNEDSEDRMLDVGKGSGRSIKGMNLVDALCYCSESLLKFGGHELAAGLSVRRDKLEEFKAKINEYAEKNLSSSDMIPTIEADCIIDFDDVNIQLAQQLQRLEPYGVGNPIPAFVLKSVYVNEITGVSEGKHTRFSFGNGSSSVTGMYFSNSPESLGIYPGDKVDVLFNLDINEWLGRKSVQLIVKDVRHSSEDIEAENREKKRFDEVWAGEAYSAEEGYYPVREDFVNLYKYITMSIRGGQDTFTHKDLYTKLSKLYPESKIGYVKLKIMLKVFIELNVIGIDEIEEETYRFKLHYSQKVNLERSSLLKRLKTQQQK